MTHLSFDPIKKREEIFTIEEYITKWIKSYKEMDGFIGG